MNQELINDPIVKAIAKAIAYTENGGKVDVDNPVAGKTGEAKSIYQFTPATWKNYSKEVFGQDNIPINSDTETAVVMHKVKGWLDKGYKPEQIASIWNAGPGEPDAYSGKFSNGSSSVGVNKKYNVPFNVPKYAQSVTNYTNKFLEEEKAKSNTPQAQEQPQATEEQKGKLTMLKDKLVNLLSNNVQHASAQEQPNVQNMPVMQQNQPPVQPIAQQNSQNMPGLLRR